MKKLIVNVILLSFSISQTAQAMDVWVIPVNPMPKEKLNLVIKDLPDELTQNETHAYPEIQLQNPIPPAKREEISQLMSTADGASLRGEFPAAIQKYETAITEMRKYPNIAGLSKITLMALIKTAELYALVKDSVKEKIFWKKAFAWDPRAQLNPEIFSPRTIAKFRTVQNENSKLPQLTLKIQVPRSSLIYLDGQKFIEVSGKTKVYTGKHQWAVLIPGSSWQVENFEAQNITGISSRDNFISFVFKPEPLVLGSCEQPSVDKKLFLPAHTRLVTVFDDGRCLRVYDGDSWFDLKGRQIMIVAETPTLPGDIPKALMKDVTKISRLPIKEEKLVQKIDLVGKSEFTPVKRGNSWFSKLTRSPWFWVGVSVVTIGTIVAIKQGENQSNNANPSHRVTEAAY